MGICRCCGEHREETEFALTGYTRKRDGIKTRKRICKACAVKAMAEWSRKHPRAVVKHSNDWRERNRFRHVINTSRRSAYPCTATEDEITKAFTGYCAICGVKEEGQKLHMDHDHDTGQFRGWLCSTCNVGLGMFRDSQHLLTRAMEYLTP